MRSHRGYDREANRARPETGARIVVGDTTRAGLNRCSAAAGQEPGRRRRWPIVALIVAMVVGISLLFPAGRHQWAISLFRQPTHYTALFFNKVSALPTTTARNETMTVSFTIGNHEGQAVHYRYVLTDSYGKQSQTLGQSTKTVASGATWTVWRVVRPKCAVSPCRIEVSLPGHPETIDFRVVLVVRPGGPRSGRDHR